MDVSNLGYVVRGADGPLALEHAGFWAGLFSTADKARAGMLAAGQL